MSSERRVFHDRVDVWLRRVYLALLIVSFACLLVAAFGFIFLPDW